MRILNFLVALTPIAVLAIVLGRGWCDPTSPEPVQTPVRQPGLRAGASALNCNAVTASKRPVPVAQVPQPENLSAPDFLVGGPPPAAQAPSKFSIVTVKVLNEWSRPIEGVDVRAGLPKVRTITDGHGIARLHVKKDWNGRWSTSFVFSAPGYVTMSVNGRSWWIPHVVWLRRGHRIFGTCVDSAGNPVPGLKLWLNPGMAYGGIDLITDAQGRFACNEAWPRSYVLFVEDEHWVAERAELIPQETGVRIVVYRPARLTGRLQFPMNAEQVTGLSSLALQRLLFRRDLCTVPQGRSVRTKMGMFSLDFEFDCLPGWVNLLFGERVVARLFLKEGETYESGDHTIVPVVNQDKRTEGVQASGEQELDASDVTGAPIPTARVRGYLMGVDGQPMTHGSLLLCKSGTRRCSFGIVKFDGDEVPPDPSEATCSDKRSSFENGYFDFGGVESGTYDLVWKPVAWQPGMRAVLRRAILMPEPPVDVDLGTLHLDVKPTSFLVRVRRVNGLCVPGAVVRLLDVEQRDHEAAAACTDAAGIARFRVFDPAGLDIVVSGPQGVAVRQALPVAAVRSAKPITVTITE